MAVQSVPPVCLGAFQERPRAFFGVYQGLPDFCLAEIGHDVVRAAPNDPLASRKRDELDMSRCSGTPRNCNRAPALRSARRDCQRGDLFALGARIRELFVTMTCHAKYRHS